MAADPHPTLTQWGQQLRQLAASQGHNPESIAMRAHVGHMTVRRIFNGHPVGTDNLVKVLIVLQESFPDVVKLSVSEQSRRIAS